jgi:predicted nucleotidyltransferase
MDYAEVLRALSSKGARFASAALVEEVRLFGLSVPVLRREELIRLKRAAGREKDLVDVRELERLA